MNSSIATDTCRPECRSAVFWSVATVLLILSLALHVWRIDSAPPGFNIDESSNAYNAYCIARTGADEYGTRFPMFFRCFDDYSHDPVVIYTMAPVVGMFGLQRWAVRLPSALFGILASIAFAFLVQQHCRRRWLSLLSGFCFSVIPWLFPASRSAVSGYTPLVWEMIMGWLLALVALRKRSCVLAVCAGLLWALPIYTYSLGRPMSVLTLLCFGLAFVRVLVKRWKVGLAFVFSFTAVTLPLIPIVFHNQAALTKRFQDVWIKTAEHPRVGLIVSNFLSRYPDYFSPAFLFFKGDQNLRQHTGRGGELFVFLAPLVLAGLYCLARFVRSRPCYRFIGLGLVVYPLAAALTPDRMHSGRCVQGVVFWLLTAAIGADFLWRRRVMGRAILLAACCAGVFETGWYLWDYFGPYQVRSRSEFQANIIVALQDCFRAVGDNKTLYISASTFSPFNMIPGADFKPYFYIHLLFFGRIDPLTYQHSGIPRDRVLLYDGSITNPGLLLRCTMSIIPPTEGRTLPLAGATYIPGNPTYVHNQEPVPPNATLVETKPVDGPFPAEVRYEVYEVK
jgi:4-amino-4-deoxy-L-arabinose transferase-like glycosyltransferase